MGRLYSDNTGETEAAGPKTKGTALTKETTTFKKCE